MNDTLTTIITVVGTVAASGGFWAWLSKRSILKSAQTQLLLGLAHNEIIRQGMAYLAEGSITKDQYEDLEKYLYAPYSVFGGNGLAEKVMIDVKLLPMSGSGKTRIRVVKEHDDSHAYTGG